ncbi:MAG: 3-dehydroquinate synthase [Bacteroidales bacterium]|nr:3-dehydroquinate synthase [Bacteroidales bacterium]
MEQINIYSGKKAISRIVTSDSLRDLASCLEPYRNIYAVVDENLARKCPATGRLTEILKRRNAKIKLIETSEEGKTLETVMDICAWLLENGADRDALVVAAGGGITTDMVGFASCIYKRGVRFAYVPTTLLSQVDAAIGGKTGVNFDKYKNILGIIRQPVFTYMCPQLLESLPQRDYLSGVAEMLKTFVIEDNGNYQKAADLFFDISSEYHVEVMMYGKDEKQAWSELLKKHRRTLSELISAAARVKAGVVSRDQFEKDERRKLNLGHTFAHAIETLAQREASADGLPAEEKHFPEGVTHGEAVAMGMVLAAKLADRYYRNDHNDPTELEGKISTDLWDCNIPCYCPYSIDEMAQIMKKDKKAEGGKVHFVLPKAIGDVEIVALAVDEVCRLME